MKCCGSSKVLLPWHLIDQKVQIKVKAKSKPEGKNGANSFELDNGHASKVQPVGSTGDQCLCYLLCKYCYEFGDVFILMPSWNFYGDIWSLYSLVLNDIISTSTMTMTKLYVSTSDCDVYWYKFVASFSFEWLHVMVGVIYSYDQG